MTSNPIHFSIKLKLSLALILTGLSLIIIYVVLANKIFESDKISYVFEAQNSKLNSLKREMDHRFEETLFSAKVLLSTLDASGKLPPTATDLFNNDKSILAIEIWDESTKQSLFKIEKAPGVLNIDQSARTAVAGEENVPYGAAKILNLKDQNFLLLFHMDQDKGSHLLTRVLMDGHGFLPQGELNQPLVLTKNGEVIASVASLGFDNALLQELAQDFNDDNLEHTTLWKFQSQKFLVSSTSLSFGQFKVIAFIPEKEALGALKTLMYRSLVFLVFSSLALIFISLLLARGLTSNLQILTVAASEIAKGNFDQVPQIQSKDEMGVLSGAMIKMSKEIIRLLEDTRDKARMESELKTAKLVQESLFPLQATASINELEINGINISSTECGGDWWYYFTQGDDVYIAIADATGHGTPAALITASARAVFSRLEKEKLSLAEMMLAWDFAVSSCSRQRVFMTGMLVKLNSKTGEGCYLSAGHESPYLFNVVGESFEPEFLDLDIHPVLGEGMDPSQLREQPLLLKKNSSLVLYTDGLFSVEDKAGKKLNEKRLGKAIAEKLDLYTTANSITQFIHKKFEDFRQAAELPDDVTLVTIRRTGASLNSHLENESGFIAKNP